MGAEVICNRDPRLLDTSIHRKISRLLYLRETATKMAFNWICPHCNRAQTVVDNRYSRAVSGVGLSDLAEGTLAFERTSIGCANPDCRKLTLTVRVGADNGKNTDWQVNPTKVIFSRRLLPEGAALPQPDYIPEPLREDYYEACLIRDLSPKASATLARRCLQGMIRDFCKISKPRLIDEIKELNKSLEEGIADRAISEETVQAIDHVRSLGNIGAHMEADINVIVQVDPGEAQAMIELIELLFDEWYGARHDRQEKLSRLGQMKLQKDQIKLAGKAQTLLTAPVLTVTKDSSMV